MANEDQNNNNNKDDFQRGLLLDTKPKTKKPSMYNVLLLNDDYTPMEFVVMVLEKIFNKKQEEATQIMLHVHKNGIGVCGTFTYEVAESKCKSVMDMAKKMNILYNAQWKKVNAVTKFRKNIKRSISTSDYL